MLKSVLKNELHYVEIFVAAEVSDTTGGDSSNAA